MAQKKGSTKKDTKKGAKAAAKAPAKKKAVAAAPAVETPEGTGVGGAAEAGKEAPAKKVRAVKTVEELRAEYEQVVGRPTGSTDRRYLLWKIGEARKGRVTVGPVNRGTGHAAGDFQVLPLRMLRSSTALLDTAWAALGAKGRSAFIREALVEKLRAGGGAEAEAAAAALEAEAGIGEAAQAQAA